MGSKVTPALLPKSSNHITITTSVIVNTVTTLIKAIWNS